MPPPAHGRMAVAAYTVIAPILLALAVWGVGCEPVGHPALPRPFGIADSWEDQRNSGRLEHDRTAQLDLEREAAAIRNERIHTAVSSLVAGREDAGWAVARFAELIDEDGPFHRALQQQFDGRPDEQVAALCLLRHLRPSSERERGVEEAATAVRRWFEEQYGPQEWIDDPWKLLK